MTQAGNQTYRGPDDVPPVVPVFPLPAALLLPRGQMPLNIFEPRYLAMVDGAMRGDRVIGMIQPRFDKGPLDLAGRPALCRIGCLGRITQYAETGDGRLLVTLSGIARFEVDEELATTTPYRQVQAATDAFADDFKPHLGEAEVDRKTLMRVFRAYLEANNLEADWSSFDQAPTEALVNTLSMMAPYGPAEKQALLEAQDLKTRADMLVALTEMVLAGGDGQPRGPLQ
ncbi:LON peptidase substrate-binding domain-containing protein [Prosthecomicrobium sp. N25]|uniref:LON peptidase substrate-binding domain-containing protein n=1 Tax=Prosthecomicrobium sp. N25 TaxID=3129254 RepID=UPI0030774409